MESPTGPRHSLLQLLMVHSLIPSRNYLWSKRAASIKVNLSLQATHFHCLNSRQLWSLDELQSSLWNQLKIFFRLHHSPTFPSAHSSFLQSLTGMVPRVLLNKTYCMQSLPANLFREANLRNICCQIPLRNSLTLVPEYKHL